MSSALAESTLVVSEGSGRLLGLHERTGRQVWEFRAGAWLTDPLLVQGGLVWVLDWKGRVTGHNPATGAPIVEHQLPRSGWGWRVEGEYAYFAIRTGRLTFGTTGHPARLHLSSGQLEFLSQDVVRITNHLVPGAIIVPEFGEVAFFAAPTFQLFDLASGRRVGSWPVPDRTEVGQTINLGGRLLTIAERAGCASCGPGHGTSSTRSVSTRRLQGLNRESELSEHAHSASFAALEVSRT